MIGTGEQQIGTAEQRNSRTAEQQNSRTAEQQNSRTAEQQSRIEDCHHSHLRAGMIPAIQLKWRRASDLGPTCLDGPCEGHVGCG
jgi:hypothetical protein